MDEIAIHVVDQSGTEHRIAGLSGWRVMEVIRDHSLPIKAECGGACSCATCHVYVAEEWTSHLPAMMAEEEAMLDEAFQVEDHSRLSCQIILSKELEGLRVTLAGGTHPDD